MNNLKPIDPLKLLNDLYSQGIRVMRREMVRLNAESIRGKLSVNHARDLRDYLKLLKDWKEGMDKVRAQTAQSLAQPKDTSEAALSDALQSSQ